MGYGYQVYDKPEKENAAAGALSCQLSAARYRLSLVLSQIGGMKF